MKQSTQLLTVFSLIIGSLFFSSCNKHHEDETPCDDPVEVIATDPSLYNFGHFILYNEFTTGFAPSQTYLRAKNWKDYSSKIIPGKHYMLGFKYVDCDDNTREGGFCGNDGRCGVPILRCIEICCLKEVATPTCFGLGFDNIDFDNLYSRSVSNSYIEDHSLKTTAYFSGCSQNDDVKFKLELRELPLANPAGPFVFEAKVNEIQDGVTCMAVFNRNVCFDLTEISEMYKRNNMLVPDEVLIRLHEGNDIKELTYHPIK